MKRLISTLLLFVILLMPIRLKAETKSYSIEKLREKVTIAENGDVYVEEELNYSFVGSFNGIYRNLPKKGSKGFTITEVLVRDKSDAAIPLEKASNSNDNTYEVTDTRDECKIKIFSKGSDEHKTFILRYIIHGAAVKKADLGQLNWSFYTVENNIPVKAFELHLSLKDSDFDMAKSHFEAKIHGSSLKDTSDAKGIHITGEDLTGVLGIELKFQPDYLQIPEENSDKGIVGTIIILAVIAFAVILVIKMVLKDKRYKSAVQAYRSQLLPFNEDTLSSPPSELPPALVDLLINERYVSASAIPATLFYLSSRGFYTMEKDPNTKAEASSEEPKENLAFKLNPEKILPSSSHIKFFMKWMSKYEYNGVFTLKDIQEDVSTRTGAGAFQDSLKMWENIIRKEALDLGLYTSIEKKELLSNEYYDQQLKWLAYKKYLLQYIRNNENSLAISRGDEALIYAPVLRIQTEQLQGIFEKLNSQSSHSSNYYFDDSYLYSSFFLVNYFMWNNIYYNMHQDTNIYNINSSDSSFGSFSSGDSFTGGGGGDSGAF